MKSTVLTLALFSSAALMAAPKVKSGEFGIDSSHSKVGFEIPHLVVSTVEGSFTKFEGKINLNDAFEKSRFSAIIDTASIDTGVEKRDEHLRSPDFFDAKKYPTIKFESTSIKGSPDSFKATGNLTLHGVTKPVTLDGQYLGAVPNDGFGNEKVVLKASTKISRKDFGLTWNNMVEAGPVVGDEVTINLTVEAGRALAAAPKK